MLLNQYKRHFRETMLLAYPICLSQMGHIMVGVVDTAMVGHIGTIEQAAVALANSIYVLVLVFGIGVSYGLTPLVAEADSSNHHEENAKLLRAGLVSNILLGIGLFAILFFFSPLFRHLDQPVDVVKIAIPFFNVLVLGMIPLSVFFALKQFTEGLSLTKVAMFVSIGANLLNVLLNYVLIFGKFGFPEMGVMGSAWASFISRVVMAVLMFAYVYYNKRFKHYWKGFDLKFYSTSLIKKILAIGIPSGFQFIFEVGAFSFAAIMIGWIGSSEMAAHQIALSMAALTYMVASGISAATTVRVSNNMGVKNIAELRLAGFSSLLMVGIFMFCCAMLFITFNDSLPYLFTKESNVISITSGLLVIAAFFQLSDGLQVVGLGALRGLTDVKIPTVITLIAYWLIGLPLCYYMAFYLQMGISGIWYGLMIGLTAAAILLLWRFNHVSKRIV